MRAFPDLFPRSRPHAATALPPGQRAISSFPRYGTHFAARDPGVPARPLIEVAGPNETIELDAAALEGLPRADLVADLHCVAGWTACGLHWQGVRFRDIFERFITPESGASAEIGHIRAVGRDGFRAVLALEDAIAEDVLVADRLDGAPLPVEHGGPFRLVSASQYGYKSVKHLCRIELCAAATDDHLNPLVNLGLKAVAPHPRARVWHEERNRALPPWSVRWIYLRVLHPVIYTLCYLGGRRAGAEPTASHSATQSTEPSQPHA